MPTLLERIEASAEQRLKLPPDRRPGQEVARYKNFLKVESHRLRIMHRGGGTGRAVCQARADMVDVLLRHVLEGFKQSAPAGEFSDAPVALVAIGGYGRGELNPHSDIDIMFLHDGALATRSKPHPYLALLSDGLLWDIGLKVGNSVRTVEECVKVGNSDMQSKTSLIEARLITGDERLFRQMQQAVLKRCVKGHEDEYIEARLKDQATRRAKFGNSATMVEPNIKSGCGGLRDYQNLLWMSFFKYHTRSLEDLEKLELINTAERRQLDAAYDFLLRTRNELHYQVNRPVDVLHKNNQPPVANSLGFTDRSPSRRLEQFMRVLYMHMRHIYLLTRVLEQRLALLPQPKRMTTFKEFLRARQERAQYPIDGFKFIKGEIYPATPRVFRDQPRRLMRVFLHAQQRNLRLHPNLTQLLRHYLDSVKGEFLRDEHMHQTFLEILAQRGTVARVLREMHDAGFLARYLPEFGKLTCLVQHEFFHQYTVDEHTLVCVEHLDKIAYSTEPPHSQYTDMLLKLERPAILYLAMILHDAGKAAPGDDHSVASSKLALKVAKRLGLDANTTATLRLLIEQHLTMAVTSQRRDLDDPAVIRHFAGIIKTPENLKMLTLHTFADSLGTSEQLWNGFKDSLLQTLYNKTLHQLTGGTDFLVAEAKRREMLASEVRELMPRSFGLDELDSHFTGLPRRYFEIHDARRILNDLTLVHRFMHLQLAEEDMALQPVIHWHNEPDKNYTTVHICTWDRSGLFAKITGSFAAAGQNILAAQIFSRQDGIVLDTFYVADAETGKMVGREAREQFEGILRSVLTKDADLEPLVARRQGTYSAYQPLAGESVPTEIHFDNATSETRTVVDIETLDRVGLLFAISKEMAALGLDISVAKISTEIGVAIDSFYVYEPVERKGEPKQELKILDRDRQQIIAQRLRAAIEKLDVVK